MSRLTRMQGLKSRRETTPTGMDSATGIHLSKLSTTEPYWREQNSRMLRGDGMMLGLTYSADMTRRLTHVGGTDRLYATLEALTTMMADQGRQSSNVGRRISLEKSDTSRSGWQVTSP